MPPCIERARALPVRLLLAYVLCAGVSESTRAADAVATHGDGRAVFVRALATAEASGVQRALALKDWVYVADTLRTTEKAVARFVMRDHTLLAMKPGTTIVLSEYQFKVDDTTASKMVTKVTSGGLRALTGLIDKRDPDKVVLETPLATAGVRGTALRVDLYPGKEEIIFDFGRGYVRNQAGRVDVDPGWGARVISATILPELFKVEQDRLDPAFIALDLLERGPPDLGRVPPLPLDPGSRRDALDGVAGKAAERAREIDPADQVILLGMLEQVPNPDEERTLAILEGLLRAAIEPESPRDGKHGTAVVPGVRPEGPDAPGSRPGTPDTTPTSTATTTPGAPETAPGTAPSGTPATTPNTQPGSTPSGRTPVAQKIPEIAINLVQTEVQLVPERAPEVIEILIRLGIEPELAITSVLESLLPIWPETVPQVLKEAEHQGVDPQRVDEIIDGVRQSTPCLPGSAARDASHPALACAMPAVPSQPAHAS